MTTSETAPRRTASPASGPRVRRRDAERTKSQILEVAGQEFARNGYSGARVDEIAARMSTTKRMIYYYFGGKQGLYVAVLEHAYGQIRSVEQEVDVDHLSPIEALRTLCEFTFDYDSDNPDFIHLVAVENIHGAEHMAHSDRLTGLNSPVIALIQSILDRGRAEGVITRDVTAIEVHVMMSALCFFRVANQPTIKTIFDYDMTSAANRERHRAIVGDMLVAWLSTS